MPQDEFDAAPIVVVGWVLLLVMIGLSVRKTPYAKGSRALLAATVVGAAAVGMLVFVYLAIAPRAKFVVVDPWENALFTFYLALGYFALVSIVALLLWLPIIDFGQDRLVYAVLCGGLAAGLPLVFFGKDWLVKASVVAIGGAIAGFVAWKIAHLRSKQPHPLPDDDPALNMDAVKAAKGAGPCKNNTRQ